MSVHVWIQKDFWLKSCMPIKSSLVGHTLGISYYQMVYLHAHDITEWGKYTLFTLRLFTLKRANTIFLSFENLIKSRVSGCVQTWSDLAKYQTWVNRSNNWRLPRLPCPKSARGESSCHSHSKPVLPFSIHFQSLISVTIWSNIPLRCKVVVFVRHVRLQTRGAFWVTTARPKRSISISTSMTRPPTAPEFSQFKIRTMNHSEGELFKA